MLEDKVIANALMSLYMDYTVHTVSVMFFELALVCITSLFHGMESR